MHVASGGGIRSSRLRHRSLVVAGVRIHGIQGGGVYRGLGVGGVWVGVRRLVVAGGLRGVDDGWVVRWVVSGGRDVCGARVGVRSGWEGGESGGEGGGSGELGGGE